MKQKRYKQLTEADFKQIKMLQSVNLSQGQAQKISGRSSNTVYYIYKAKDFADYKEILRVKNERAHMGRKNGKVAPEVKSVSTSNASDVTVTAEELKTLLTNIDDQLADLKAIAEATKTAVQWLENHTEVKPRKRSLFS